MNAVRCALTSNGPTIMVAGIAMALATGCSLLSDTGVTNQIGFLLVFGVLLITFVIQTWVVPTMLILLGDAAFYPLKPPEPSSKRRHDELGKFLLTEADDAKMGA